MTDRIRDILSDVTYKDGWWLVVHAPGPDAGDDKPWLKWCFTAPDIHTGKSETQHCRKWQLSYHMTTSEIVRAAYKAVLAAEEHEASEAFLYDGAMVYNPHMSIEDLVWAIRGGYVGDDYR
jgi:hypothetical protein